MKNLSIRITILFITFQLVNSFSFAQYAPHTTANPVKVCPAGTANIPITVTAFDAIGSFTLRLEYNPEVITYINLQNINPLLTDIMANDVPISTVLHKIMIVWSDINGVSLPDGSKLFDIVFNYSSGTSEIIFNNTANGGIECEYSDIAANPLIDIPTSIYYINGNVESNQVAPAGTITGATSVCQGQTGVAYSVPAIANATGYVWTLPSGATIASGNNTNAITVNYSTTASSGNISVYGTNGCGNGTGSPNFAVTVNPLPGVAGTITGTASVCQGQTGVAYSVPAIANATGYVWTLPSGATIASGNNTNAITVNYSTTASSGNISVYGTNGCGNSIASPDFAVTVNSCVVTVSGTVSYFNSVNTPLDGLIINLKNDSGNVVNTATTDANGFYSFSGVFSGNYMLDVFTVKSWTGVSCTDALLIQLHIAGLSYITLPIRLHAADVNNTNTISAADVLMIKRRIVCIDTAFTRPDWLFEIPEGGNIITVGEDNVIHNFYGLCAGDINGSNIPGASMKTDAINQLTDIESIVARKEQTISLPVHLQSAKEIGAIDLAISYPQELVSIQDVKTRHGEIIYHAQNGILRIAWSELNPLLMNESNVLLTITVKTSSAFTDNERISFSVLPESELADESAIPVTDATFMIPEIYTQKDHWDNYFRLYPNPNNGTFTLEIQPIQSLTFDVRLFNSLGVVVYQQLNIAAYGKYSTEIRSGNLAEGIYTLTVTGKDTNYIKKIVIRK
ncbi:MAG TPA: T9SS type A sorting domain-containing protein [Bacteroidales bacterium]|nr:T9SS type A sorting domain-containing protein [Bacteroidales bacterium]